MPLRAAATYWRLDVFALLLIALGAKFSHAADTRGTMCKDPSKHDPVVAVSHLLGAPNASDAKWHDETWAFKQHGPISRLTIYKAWFYDGIWHDPGELKGLQTWFGPKQFNEPNALLFGARRPHIPKNCTFAPNEGIVRAEVHWDHILRWANFTTNIGRHCAWGFPGVENATVGVVEAPTPYTYLAAFRGYEGKPLPKNLGGHKKRYIIQLGMVWAERDCGQQRSPELVSISPSPHINMAGAGPTPHQQQVVITPAPTLLPVQQPRSTANPQPSTPAAAAAAKPTATAHTTTKAAAPPLQLPAARPAANHQPANTPNQDPTSRPRATISERGEVMNAASSVDQQPDAITGAAASSAAGSQPNLQGRLVHGLLIALLAALWVL